MSQDIPHKMLAEAIRNALKRFNSGGTLSFGERDEWDRLAKSLPAKQQEFLNELVCFLDLWRYLQQRGERLGVRIVNEIQEVHRLRLTARIERLKQINHDLMKRVSERQGLVY